MICKVCNKNVEFYEPYEILNKNRVHVKCYEKEQNKMIKVGFKRLTEDAILPVKAHPTDSGFDLFANETVIVPPGVTRVIKTGVAIKLPPGYEAQVRPRSGVTSKTKLRVQLGTIDQDYTGEIGIIIDNIADFECAYPKGLKLAQLVIQALPMIECYEVDDLPETVRGSNGFGSTGI